MKCLYEKYAITNKTQTAIKLPMTIPATAAEPEDSLELSSKGALEEDEENEDDDKLPALTLLTLEELLLLLILGLLVIVLLILLPVSPVAEDNEEVEDEEEDEDEDEDELLSSNSLAERDPSTLTPLTAPSSVRFTLR